MKKLIWKKSYNLLTEDMLINILINKKPHQIGEVSVGPAGLEPATP